MYPKLFHKLTEISLAQSFHIYYSFKHFSYIVERNKILSVGYNLPDKTHPLALKFGHRFYSIHSELDAITNFPYPNRFLKRCRLINLRISKDHTVRMSKPCQFCQKLIRAFNIREVWYTNDFGKFQYL